CQVHGSQFTVRGLAYRKNKMNSAFDSERTLRKYYTLMTRKHLVSFSLARSPSRILLSLSDKTLNL
ncbi:MAG: hypothetical protein WBB70_11005, partial [Desulfobacterales bacterium]